MATRKRVVRAVAVGKAINPMSAIGLSATGLLGPAVNPNPPEITEEVRQAVLATTDPERLFTHCLARLGFDLSDENFKETPRRWLGYMREFMQPHLAHEVVGTAFVAPSQYHGMIVQANIPFRAMCAHHLLPFFGVAFVGYVPDKKVIGLSKIARLVEAVGLEYPGIQEAMTERIAHMLEQKLSCKGVITVVSATHTCMGCRGVAAPNVPTITSCIKGIYRDVPAAREEFFAISGIRHL